MSCSGGEASIIADLTEPTRLEFPALSNEHEAQVQTALGPMVSVNNPLDYNTYCWGDRDAMNRVYDAMVSQQAFDMNFLILDFPHPTRCDDTEWADAVRAFEDALNHRQATGAIITGMQENITEQYATDFSDRDLLCFFGMEEALQATEIAADIGATWQQAANEFHITPPCLR